MSENKKPCAGRRFPHRAEESLSSNSSGFDNRNGSHSQAAISARLIGSDSCTALGFTTRGRSPVLMMCRRLVAEGHNPSRPLICYRGNVVALLVASVGAAAGLRVEDSRRGAPIFRPYVPPDFRTLRAVRTSARPCAEIATPSYPSLNGHAAIQWGRPHE